MKHVIWSNEDLRLEDFIGQIEEAYPDASEAEKYQLMQEINSGKVADADTITFTPSDFCGLPSLRNRFTIVNRITPVSVYRIDTTSPVATLKNKVKFQEVITKFKDYFN